MHLLLSSSVVICPPHSGQHCLPKTVIRWGTRWKCNLARSLPITHISMPTGFVDVSLLAMSRSRRSFQTSPELRLASSATSIFAFPSLEPRKRPPSSGLPMGGKGRSARHRPPISSSRRSVSFRTDSTSPIASKTSTSASLCCVPWDCRPPMWKWRGSAPSRRSSSNVSIADGWRTAGSCVLRRKTFARPYLRRGR